jgi:hypothetical protein
MHLSDCPQGLCLEVQGLDQTVRGCHCGLTITSHALGTQASELWLFAAGQQLVAALSSVQETSRAEGEPARLGMDRGSRSAGRRSEPVTEGGIAVVVGGGRLGHAFPTG